MDPCGWHSDSTALDDSNNSSSSSNCEASSASNSSTSSNTSSSTSAIECVTTNMEEMSDEELILRWVSIMERLTEEQKSKARIKITEILRELEKK